MYDSGEADKGLLLYLWINSGMHSSTMNNDIIYTLKKITQNHIFFVNDTPHKFPCTIDFKIFQSKVVL